MTKKYGQALTPTSWMPLFGAQGVSKKITSSSPQNFLSSPIAQPSSRTNPQNSSSSLALADRGSNRGSGVIDKQESHIQKSVSKRLDYDIEGEESDSSDSDKQPSSIDVVSHNRKELHPNMRLQPTISYTTTSTASTTTATSRPSQTVTVTVHNQRNPPTRHPNGSITHATTDYYRNHNKDIKQEHAINSTGGYFDNTRYMHTPKTESINSFFYNNNLDRTQFSSRGSREGMRNFGNSCYINAVLQVCWRWRCY